MLWPQVNLGTNGWVGLAVNLANLMTSNIWKDLQRFKRNKHLDAEFLLVNEHSKLVVGRGWGGGGGRGMRQMV